MSKLFLHQPEDAQKASGVLSKLWRLYTIGFVSEKMYADMMSSYLLEQYPDPQKRDNKRTNLPRAVIEGDDFTWDVFMEALAVLRLSKCKLKLELQDKNGFFRAYTLDLLDKEPDSELMEPLRNPKGYRGKIITNTQQITNVKGWLAYVMRLVFYDYNITWKDLNNGIDKYLDVPGNLDKTRSKATTKGNNRDRILKVKVGWDGFLRGLDILEFKSLRLTLDTTWGVGDKVTDVHYTFPSRVATGEYPLDQMGLLVS